MMNLLSFVIVATIATDEPELAQMLARARAASPEVRLALRDVAEAEASRIGQGVVLPVNPRLALQGRGLAVPQAGVSGSTLDPRFGYDVSLDFLFDISGAPRSRVAEAEERIEISRLALALAQSRAAARAWIAWIDLELAERLRVVTEEMVVLYGRVSEAVRQRQQFGVAAGPDVATANLELAFVRTQLEDAHLARINAEFEYRSSLDLAPSDGLPALLVPKRPPPLPQAQELLERAYARRPELALIQRRLRLLAVTEKRLGREVVPRLGLIVGYDQSPASSSYAYGGLSVDLPLAQRNQGPKAVNRAQVLTETERLELVRRSVAREVQTGRARYESLLARVALLEDEALPAAEEARRLVEEGWRAGRIDMFRMNLASRELVRVRGERLQALRNAWNEYIALMRLTGGLNE